MKRKGGQKRNMYNMKTEQQSSKGRCLDNVGRGDQLLPTSESRCSVEGEQATTADIFAVFVTRSVA